MQLNSNAELGIIDVKSEAEEKNREMMVLLDHYIKQTIIDNKSHFIEIDRAIKRTESFIEENTELNLRLVIKIMKPLKVIKTNASLSLDDR